MALVRWVNALLDLLASVKFAVAVIVVIAIACVAGTILPQGRDAAAFVQEHPAAADRIALFDKLGLTHVFSARWFIALLCVLAATVMVCSTRRLATVKRATGFARRRAFGSMLTHISILLILGGAVVRGVWGEKGYIQMREGQTVAEYESETGARTLPFALQLAKFEIVPDAKPAQSPLREASSKLIVQWADERVEAEMPATVGTIQTVTRKGQAPSAENSFRIEVLKYIPDFAVDTETHEVTSRSSEPNNPAILVAVNGPDYRNHRWVFAKFPNFTIPQGDSAMKPSPLRFLYRDENATTSAATAIKNFKSTLMVKQGDALSTRTVQVNQPLKIAGYRFYQTGYDPNDSSWTSLQVVRDPGVPLVYGGFALLIGGLFVVFYLNPWFAARETNA